MTSQIDDAVQPADGPVPCGDRISIVIPAYASERTLAACLAAVRAQTLPPFETIVVDSGPGDACAGIVAREHPWARYARSERRLVPHHAQNFGIACARGDVLVFLDPDAYPERDWLERLVSAYHAHARTVAGAIACHGSIWLDNAIHMCKFSKWLPGGTARPIDIAPSTNLLVSRRDLKRVGGFPPTPFLGDVELSRWLCASGEPPWFEPRAIVTHHHLGGFATFLRERISRGRGYGALRGTWSGAGAATLLLVSAPLRLARILWLVRSHARVAGQETVFWRGLPVVLAGHAAFLAGECGALLGKLLGPGRDA
jgi:GT2 family glycosyltransferase